MKVYKITLCFIDHDNLGLESVVNIIENARLPNHISPGTVISIDERDIGEWRDDHPLNQLNTCTNAFNDLFATDDA